MAPPLSKYQLEILNTEFYFNLQFFGRDKLYNIMKEKVKCECGCEVIKSNLKIHQTSKKHIKLMKCI